MAERRITVPLRGEMTRVDGKMPSGDNVATGLNPMKLLEILNDTLPVRGDFQAVRDSYDFAAGTAEIVIRSDDTAWLAAFDSWIAGRTVGSIQTYMRKTRRVAERFVFDARNSEDTGVGSRFNLATADLEKIRAANSGSSKVGSGGFVDRGRRNA